MFSKIFRMGDENIFYYQKATNFVFGIYDYIKKYIYFTFTKAFAVPHICV